MQTVMDFLHSSSADLSYHIRNPFTLTLLSAEIRSSLI